MKLIPVYTIITWSEMVRGGGARRMQAIPVEDRNGYYVPTGEYEELELALVHPNPHTRYLAEQVMKNTKEGDENQ